MSSKHSLFFSILILFSFSIFATINSAKEELVTSHHEFITRKLRELELNASEKLKQDLVNATEGRNHFKICGMLQHLRDEIPANTSFEELCYKTPAPDEHTEMIQSMLSKCEKDTSEFFMQIITEFTKDFNMLQMHTFLFTATEKSTPRALNLKVCLQKLEAIIRHSENEQNKKDKLDRLEELRKRLIQADSDETYPSLKHMVHSQMRLFDHAAIQLKDGKFETNFYRGMLFYGPSGTGKTEMVTALANESGCEFFTIAASELNNQENTANAIINIFAQAKAVEPYKGIIILIDDLNNLTSETINLLRSEFDACVKTHNNILTIIASNQFEIIDERIRGCFKCIQFACPDQIDSYEILKNKSQYCNVDLSEDELKFHANRMEGSSGRELTKFIQDVSKYIRNGESIEKAIIYVVDKQERNKENAKPKSPSTNSYWYSSWYSRVVAIGTGIIGFVQLIETNKKALKDTKHYIDSVKDYFSETNSASDTNSTADVNVTTRVNSMTDTKSSNNNAVGTRPVDPAPDQDTVNYGPLSETPRLDFPTRSISNTNLDNTKVTGLSKLDFLNF